MELYSKVICPHCQKVKEFADENKIELNIVDIEKSDKNWVEWSRYCRPLMRDGERMTVPLLKNNNLIVKNSDEIINYLKNYGMQKL